MKNICKTSDSFTITKFKAYRTKRMALEKVHGDFGRVVSYNQGMMQEDFGNKLLTQRLFTLVLMMIIPCSYLY